MVLQASGQIDFAQIQTEFGGSNPIGISEYYRNAGYVSPTLTYALNAITWSNSNQVIRYTSCLLYTSPSPRD